MFCIIEFTSALRYMQSSENDRVYFCIEINQVIFVDGERLFIIKSCDHVCLGARAESSGKQTSGEGYEAEGVR